MATVITKSTISRTLFIDLDPAVQEDYTDHILPMDVLRIAQKKGSGAVDIYWAGITKKEFEIQLDTNEMTVTVEGVTATDNDDLFAIIKALY